MKNTPVLYLDIDGTVRHEAARVRFMDARDWRNGKAYDL